MFFLLDTIGHTELFETIEELKEYIVTRHAEEGGFDWISEIKDGRGRIYSCNWTLEIERV